ncbi:hypothetical protein KAJ27_18565 [bacterium]|nr:hypothetical protein [bacterium]
MGKCTFTKILNNMTRLSGIGLMLISCTFLFKKNRRNLDIIKGSIMVTGGISCFIVSFRK